jgi:trimethylamine corrinoid protein
MARGVWGGVPPLAPSPHARYANLILIGEKPMEKKTIFKIMEEAILDGNNEQARQGARDALQQQIDPLEVVESGLSKGMDIVGDRFEQGLAFLPELLMAADSFNAAMEVLKPEIEAQKKEIAKGGTVLIATVKGDVHNIGRNIVATILETRGFTVLDLGQDVPALQIVEGAEKTKADVIALSSLMTTTMPNQREVMNALTEMKLRDKYFVIVGGGPVTQNWADEIGADGYGSNAMEAVALVKDLLRRKS